MNVPAALIFGPKGPLPHGEGGGPEEGPPYLSNAFLLPTCLRGGWMSDEAETLIVSVPAEDFNGMCETFCDDCGQLRLWVRREYPKTCGACGARDPLVGGIGSRLLTMAREQWKLRRPSGSQSPRR